MSAEPSQTPCVLGDLPPAQAIVRQAVPATLALLAKAIYNLVDTAYSGVYPAVLPADPAVQLQPGHRGIRQMASHLPGGATPPVCRAWDLRGAARRRCADHAGLPVLHQADAGHCVPQSASLTGGRKAGKRQSVATAQQNRQDMCGGRAARYGIIAPLCQQNGGVL